jgi:hypothetical protein
MERELNYRAAGLCGLLALSGLWFSAAASADAIVVQCTINQYSSSFAPRPDTFTILVDTDARTIATYYGTMQLRMTRKELLGTSAVSDGWHSNVAIDRNTGKFAAGTDKIDGRKYSHTELRGLCILPEALQGSKYKAPAAP